MAIETRDDCVGCDPCIGCGADRKYKVVICDRCKTEIEDDVYLIAGKQFCTDCALRTLECANAEDLCMEEE